METNKQESSQADPLDGQYVQPESFTQTDTSELIVPPQTPEVENLVLPTRETSPAEEEIISQINLIEKKGEYKNKKDRIRLKQLQGDLAELKKGQEVKSTPEEKRDPVVEAPEPEGGGLEAAFDRRIAERKAAQSENAATNTIQSPVVRDEVTEGRVEKEISPATADPLQALEQGNAEKDKILEVRGNITRKFLGSAIEVVGAGTKKDSLENALQLLDQKNILSANLDLMEVIKGQSEELKSGGTPLDQKIFKYIGATIGEIAKAKESGVQLSDEESDVFKKYLVELGKKSTGSQKTEIDNLIKNLSGETVVEIKEKNKETVSKNTAGQILPAPDGQKTTPLSEAEDIGAFNKRLEEYYKNTSVDVMANNPQNFSGAGTVDVGHFNSIPVPQKIEASPERADLGKVQHETESTRENSAKAEVKTSGELPEKEVAKIDLGKTRDNIIEAEAKIKNGQRDPETRSFRDSLYKEAESLVEKITEGAVNLSQEARKRVEEFAKAHGFVVETSAQFKDRNREKIRNAKSEQLRGEAVFDAWAYLSDDERKKYCGDKSEQDGVKKFGDELELKRSKLEAAGVSISKDTFFYLVAKGWNIGDISIEAGTTKKSWWGKKKGEEDKIKISRNDLPGIGEYGVSKFNEWIKGMESRIKASFDKKTEDDLDKRVAENKAKYRHKKNEFKREVIGEVIVYEAPQAESVVKNEQNEQMSEASVVKKPAEKEKVEERAETPAKKIERAIDVMEQKEEENAPKTRAWIGSAKKFLKKTTRFSLGFIANRVGELGETVIGLGGAISHKEKRLKARSRLSRIREGSKK